MSVTVDGSVPAQPGLTTAPPMTRPGVRGRRQRALGRLRGEIPARLTIGLGIGGVVLLLGGWALASVVMDRPTILPTPAATWRAGVQLQRDGYLWSDLRASCTRIGIGYSVSMAMAIVLGVVTGSFRSAEALLDPMYGFLRYIPASALSPLFLVWLGIDEPPKIALVVVGTVFFNILMISDVARAVPLELINSAYTLGAGRITVLRRVILPHSYPGIVDVARVNLAAGWVMLVVAELLAAQDGLAYRMMRVYRFRDVDTMFAILIIFGLIGLVSDLVLRQLRRRTAPWSEGSQ